MDEALKKKLQYLRLGKLAANWDEYLRVAAKSNYSHVRLLKHIIQEEYQQKKENARTMRLRRAKLPHQLVIETFPFDKQPNANKKKIFGMYDNFDYMTKCRNIIWMGPTGAGKTGLATAFLIQAINKGYSGRFIVFPELIDMFYKSVADHSEEKVLKEFSSCDCLLIDELGYVEVEPHQVGQFFTLMNKRHNRKSTMITTNLGFSQWTSFLKNDNLTAALIDRLTENSYVVNMKKCTSLRKRFIEG